MPRPGNLEQATHPSAISPLPSAEGIHQLSSRRAAAAAAAPKGASSPPALLLSALLDDDDDDSSGEERAAERDTSRCDQPDQHPPHQHGASIAELVTAHQLECYRLDDARWMAKVEVAKKYLDGLTKLTPTNWTRWLGEIRRLGLITGAREIMPLVSAAIWLIDDKPLRQRLQENVGVDRPTFSELCVATNLTFVSPASTAAALEAIKSIRQAENESLNSYLNRFEILVLTVGLNRVEPDTLNQWAKFLLAGLSGYSKMIFFGRAYHKLSLRQLLEALKAWPTRLWDGFHTYTDDPFKPVPKESAPPSMSAFPGPASPKHGAPGASRRRYRPRAREPADIKPQPEKASSPSCKECGWGHPTSRCRDAAIVYGPGHELRGQPRQRGSHRRPDSHILAASEPSSLGHAWRRPPGEAAPAGPPSSHPVTHERKGDTHTTSGRPTKR